MLSREERRRYARQLLLPDIGEAGQRALLDAHARTESEVAALYLTRAGVALGDAGVEARAQIPPSGDPALAEAERFLEGAFGAVEAIKAIVGVGRAGELDRPLTAPRQEEAP